MLYTQVNPGLPPVAVEKDPLRSNLMVTVGPQYSTSDQLILIHYPGKELIKPLNASLVWRLTGCVHS